MATYEVTAANQYFWQTLRVGRVTCREDAARLFRDYLAAPDQQAAEEYELEQGLLSDSKENCKREFYIYDFNDCDITRCGIDDGARNIVEMVDSGGNG